jgi:hypothetical protein
VQINRVDIFLEADSDIWVLTMQLDESAIWVTDRTPGNCGPQIRMAKNNHNQVMNQAPGNAGQTALNQNHFFCILNKLIGFCPKASFSESH